MEEALRQLGHGMNNVHTALLANQAASERRHAALDAKIDVLRTDVFVKLDDVCDRGLVDHQKFKDDDVSLREALLELKHRMELQEARDVGRADILKPAMDFISKRLGVILLVAYMGWNQFGAPLVAAAFAPPVHTVSIPGIIR